MNKFKTAWDDYNKSSYKKKVLMDQVRGGKDVETV